ncbi:2OG-Fe(II) oxygenase [Candidatus Pelagibacter sp.]|nr:2OG-Fe(II) oxygenase [Candidatus Pelagibacter sp.]
MNDYKRFSNIRTLSEPYPILIIDNFMTEEEAKEGYDIITSSKSDEYVNGGRFNIRKGTNEFKKFISKNKVFENLYNFFNDESQFDFLYTKLQNTMKNSENKYQATNLPTNFNKTYFVYKRNIHQNKFFKKILNYFWIKTPDIIKKNLRLIYTCNYFDINFSYAKKGYKLITHRDKDTRVIVFLLYLNDLKTEDGGALEVYSKNNDNDFELKDKFTPKTGKLIAFLSNPDSYHNVSEIVNADITRCFCYGSYSSNQDIVWKKID